MALHQPFQVIGYHSCDKELGMRVLTGQDTLRPSGNRWDWLGSGVYFWEQNPYRALEYANECAAGKQKFAGKIEKPFVLGAIIELGNCLNLVEPTSLEIVQVAYKGLKKTIKEINGRMPVNNGDNRALDCAVMQFVHQSNLNENLPAYDTVRCPFQEGVTLYEGSNFTTRLHLEIAVRNPETIKGYFLPRPLNEFNPYL